MTLPVIPGDSSIMVSGAAYFTDGGYALLSPQNVTVSAGETASLSWTVSPAEKGTIGGAIIFSGKPDEVRNNEEVQRIYLGEEKI